VRAEGGSSSPTPACLLNWYHTSLIGGARDAPSKFQEVQNDACPPRTSEQTRRPLAIVGGATATMATRTRKATARLLIAWLTLPETWRHRPFSATIRFTRRPTKSAANPGLSGHQQPLNFLARGRADDAAEAGALERGGGAGEPHRLRLWPALRQGQGKRGVKHIARCERIGGLDRKGRLMPHFRVVGCVRTPIRVRSRIIESRNDRRGIPTVNRRV
jgi:hypothetical protein